MHLNHKLLMKISIYGIPVYLGYLILENSLVLLLSCGSWGGVVTHSEHLLVCVCVCVLCCDRSCMYKCNHVYRIIYSMGLHEPQTK